MSNEISVDLHLHTTYSDGVLSPKDLVNLCYKNGLKYISITDHDCTDGIQESIEIAKSSLIFFSYISRPLIKPANSNPTKASVNKSPVKVGKL